MRRYVPSLLFVATVAACGHTVDTSIQEDGSDASRPSADAGDAILDAGGISPDGAMNDADPSRDAPANPADAIVPGVCTKFDERFAGPYPWAYDAQGWTPKPLPDFDVPLAVGTNTSFGVFAAKEGSSSKPTLVHAIAPGCTLHLKLAIRVGGGAASASLTFARIRMDGGSIDFVRPADVGAAPVQAKYLGQTVNLGPLTPDSADFAHLDVTVPGDGGIVEATFNSIKTGTPITLPNMGTRVTQIEVGVVDVSFNATGASFNTILDDISVE